MWGTRAIPMYRYRYRIRIYTRRDIHIAYVYHISHYSVSYIWRMGQICDTVNLDQGRDIIMESSNPTVSNVDEHLCADCDVSKATVQLTCGKHFICLSCLVKRGSEQPQDTLKCTLVHVAKKVSPDYHYSTAASVPVKPEKIVTPTQECGTETKKADNYLFPGEPSLPGIRIFVDDSSIWIEAKKLQSKIKRFKTGEDHRVRIDMGKLADAVAGGRPVEQGILYGSEPPPIDTVWQKIREKGFCVKSEKRSAMTGKAKLIHTMLVADVTAIAIKTRNEERTTIALVTGDADVIPAIEKVLEEDRWKVEVYMWNHAISSRLKKYTAADECKGRVEIKPLDECLEKLAFTVMKFDISNKLVRQIVHSCGVVFTMVPGAFKNRIPTRDWLNQLEGIAQWPCQYYWFERNQTQTNDLVIVFKRDPHAGNFDIATFLDVVNSESKYKYQIPFTRNIQSFQQFIANEYKEEKNPILRQFDAALEQVGILYADDVSAGYGNEAMYVSESSDMWSVVQKKVCPPTRQRYTEPCPYKYNCVNGTQCFYKHSDLEIKYFKQRSQGRGNPLRKVKLCTFFSTGTCTKTNEDCDFAHGDDDGWCLNCTSEGHFTQACPKKTQSETGNVQ